MPKPRQRARLDNGLSLDIVTLIEHGPKRGVHKLDFAGSGTVELRMDAQCGLLRFQFPDLSQSIELTAVPRPFGGHQWYWLCPMTGNRASVLWMPRGQDVFASQKYWRGRNMAYATQFLSPSDRAHRGIRRIETRLGTKDDAGTLYKPKWQRWGTFNRSCEQLDAYDKILDDRLARVLGRIMAKG